MAAPRVPKFIFVIISIFICSYVVAVCADLTEPEEASENTDKVTLQSVVGEVKVKPQETPGFSMLEKSPNAELYEEEDDGECPDPDLIAAYDAKYRSTSDFNTTMKFIEFMMGSKCYNQSSLAVCELSIYEQIRLYLKNPKPKPMCQPLVRRDNETATVQLVNSSSLLQLLGHKNNLTVKHCTVVLFYAPWCMFCAQMAPHYNALARAFPQLNILAIDAVSFSSLNTRYGTVAVPNMLVFYNDSKAVAKYNQTERNFVTMASFVSNITGFKPDPKVQVVSADFEGPLSSKPSDDIDWLLVLAWVFVITFCSTVFAKSNFGRNMWIKFLRTFKLQQPT